MQITFGFASFKQFIVLIRKNMKSKMVVTMIKVLNIKITINTARRNMLQLDRLNNNNKNVIRFNNRSADGESQ